LHNAPDITEVKMAQCNRVATWACFLVVALPWTAAAQTPKVGQVQKLTVITLSMQVGNTDSDTRRIAYAPPPGWYVKSHQVNCTKKSGNTSYSVNTVPGDWAFVTEDKVEESYKLLLDLAGQAQNAGLRTKFAAEREQLLAEVRKVRSTHHALVVDATVRGEGFLRAGGSLDMTVTAELVYVGTEESLARAVAEHQKMLNVTGR
jgi:hypothetical protein